VNSSSSISGEVKRTIQKSMRQIHPKRTRSQSWKTFLRNHAAEVWACDFLQVTDLCFRPLFAFFIIELQSRRVPRACDALSNRLLGGAYRCGRRRRMGKRRTTSFGILIANSGRVLHVWQPPVALRCCEHRIELHEQMPSANAFWGASGEHVWITSSFSMRSNSPGFSWRMQRTSIMPDRIKGSSSGFRPCRCFLLLHRSR
jgi:hypothetical protein